MGFVADVDWSPDGTTLAVTGNRGLLELSVDGAEPRVNVSVEQGKRLTEVAWSPDGRTIAFVELRPHRTAKDLFPATYVLRAVPVNAHAPESVVGLGDCYCLGLNSPTFVWAPDGSALAYTRIAGTLSNARPDGVHLIHPDGTGHERVVSFGGASYRLAWQPLVSD